MNTNYLCKFNIQIAQHTFQCCAQKKIVVRILAKKMSKNDVILVRRSFDKLKKKYYYNVIYCDNADENWLHFANKQNSTSKRTMKRCLALIIAHNLQKKCDSEYGVRELY
tara:strand:- start:3287 stop:3616 length:330 start_codon:yes stop_codon:yes gene_type:complete